MSLHKKSNRQQNESTSQKDKQMRKKKKLHNSFHIDKYKRRLWRLWRVVDCWKNWGLLILWKMVYPWTVWLLESWVTNECWIDVNQRNPGHIYDPLHPQTVCVCVSDLNETRHRSRTQEEEAEIKLLFSKSDWQVFPWMNVCLTCLHRPTTKNRPHTSIDLCSVEITGALYCTGSVQQELRTAQDIGLAFKLKVNV